MVPVKDMDGMDIPDDAAAEPVDVVLTKADKRLAEPPLQPPVQEILIDGKSYFSERVHNPWDCESILSTYSNLDNNPVRIQGSRKRGKKKNNNKKTDLSKEGESSERIK